MSSDDREYSKVRDMTPLDLIGCLKKPLEGYDETKKERNRTTTEAEKEFGRRDTWSCWLCGRQQKNLKEKKMRMAAAHIIPVEEGGKTNKNNLIPLCDSNKKMSVYVAQIIELYFEKFPRHGSIKNGFQFLDGLRLLNGISPAKIPCHQLFDYGLIARKKIKAVRCTGKPHNGAHKHIRDDALKIEMRHLDTDYCPATALTKRLQRLEEDTEKKMNVEWFEGMLKCASTARRLGSEKFLLKARNFLEDARQYNKTTEDDDKYARNMSRFHYEEALCHMVSQPADLDKVIRLLNTSCDKVKKMRSPKGKMSFAMSQDECIHAQTFRWNNIDKHTYHELSGILKQCLKVFEASPGNTATRWEINGLMHHAQLDVKARKIDEARRHLNLARELRNERDISEGWTLFQGVHLNIIEAGVLAHEGAGIVARSGDATKEYREALMRLARAITVMSVARGKRPEGYKDVAQCAAWCFRQIDDSARAQLADALASYMQDSRSGFWIEP